MRQIELIYLFNLEKKAAAKDANGKPSLRYIMRAYDMVLKCLNDYFGKDDTIEISDIDVLEITEHMKNKLKDLLTKSIKDIDTFKRFTLENELKQIIGIGQVKATKLLDAGLLSIEELRHPKWWKQLNTDTKLVLSAEPIRIIPHKEISCIESKLIGFKLSKVQLVGSYRRKATTSKDIDIMIVSDDIKIMDKYLKYLNKLFNHIYIYAKGADKMSIILEINKKKRYKADIFRTHPDYYWAHLLYATGSKINNLRMRSISKRKGYILNQKGLWKGAKRILDIDDDEREYYKILDIPYLPPEKR